MTINFKNLIIGRHESKVLFMWNPKEGAAILGAFLGIKEGIQVILARDGVTLSNKPSSKSSAQSQERIIGISRVSGNPYRKIGCHGPTATEGRSANTGQWSDKPTCRKVLASLR